MHLNPDEIIFWLFGVIKLNATIVYTWAIMLLMSVTAARITHSLATTMRRSRWQELMEILVMTINQQIATIGLRSPSKYIVFLGTFFLFMALASIGTIIPGYEAPTGSLSTLSALALCVFISVPALGIVSQGTTGYLKSYIKPTIIKLPFNIISEGYQTLTQVIRLLGNIMSSAMIIAILFAITPFFFPVVMMLLGLLSGMVQAYIFTVLATVYIAAAVRAKESNS